MKYVTMSLMAIMILLQVAVYNVAAAEKCKTWVWRHGIQERYFYCGDNIGPYDKVDPTTRYPRINIPKRPPLAPYDQPTTPQAGAQAG